jgi:hypothetical protein
MTIPTAVPDLSLDPWEEGITEDEARRRQRARNQSLIELIESWISEDENMTREGRLRAERDWEEFARGIDENRAPGQKLYS